MIRPAILFLAWVRTGQYVPNQDVAQWQLRVRHVIDVLVSSGHQYVPAQGLFALARHINYTGEILSFVGYGPSPAACPLLEPPPLTTPRMKLQPGICPFPVLGF